MNFKRIIVIVLFVLSTNVFSQSISFESIVDTISQLQQEEQYNKAKLFIADCINDFPAKWFELSKELIYVNEKLGLYEENLKIFNEAHNHGYFYFIHPRMPEYEPYKDLKEFDSISKNDLQLLNDSNEKSKTIYEVHLPDNYNETSTFPLIILLHGGGKNIKDLKEHWQVDLLNKKCIKVYVQSYRHFDSENYGWGGLNDRLIKDFTNIYNDLISTYNVDTSNIIIGGISAGASIGIEVALKSIIPVKACIVYCPVVPRFIRNNEIDLIKDNNVKSFIVSGASDYLLDQQRKMINIFDSLRIDYKYVLVNDMGHQYPVDEKYYIEEAIKYIYDEEQEEKSINNETSKKAYLLETVWGGTKRTNKFNPDNYSPGCHSTALAQIMYYHKLQPYGEKEYVTKRGHQIKESYDNHDFNWGLFVNNVDENIPQENVDELALYRYYLATVVEKNFGNGSYGKTFHKGQIKKHFNCKVRERFGFKTFLLSRRKVRNIITKEINNKRPVYFHYTDFNGKGHSIVIDGYKQKDNDLFVHANFGWGGKNNGWYKYEKNCFIDNQKLELIITIKPKS